MIRFWEFFSGKKCSFNFDNKLSFCMEEFTGNNVSALFIVEVSILKSIFWAKFLPVEKEHIVLQPTFPSQE